MSSVLFFQLVLSAVNAASFLVVFASSDKMDYGVFVALVGIITISLPTALHCKLSEQATCDMADIGDAFSQCAWYNLPAKQQKMFILPILRAQRNYRMMGLGMFECSLATFLSVKINYKLFKIILLTFFIASANP